MTKENNKVILIPRKIWLSKITIINTLLLIIVLFFNYFCKVTIDINIDPKIFISISITGLSFSLALFVATKNVFSVEDLAKIYVASIKYPKYKDDFNIIFGRFIWTSALFLSLGIESIIGLIQIKNIGIDFNFLRQPYYLIMVYTFLMSSFNLFSIILDISRDSILSAIRESEKKP